jgi:RNA polymerase sigma-70 factor, ECF subfamily
MAFSTVIQKTSENNFGCLAELTLNSFEEFFTTYQPKLQRFIYSIVNDTELAHDLTQDTFLAAYNNLRREVAQANQTEPYKQTETRNHNLISWLYTIARNKAIDALRRRQRVFSLSETADLDFLSNLGNPGKNFEVSSQVRVELENTIKKEGYQRIAPLIMYMQGFSYQEIAQMSGTSLAKIKSQIFRIKKRLRDTLTEKPGSLVAA